METGTAFELFDRPVDPVDRLLRRRVVMLSGEIDAARANDVMARLLWLEQEAEDEPIELRINSPGGEVLSGLALIDTMAQVRCPVATTCAPGRRPGAHRRGGAAPAAPAGQHPGRGDRTDGRARPSRHRPGHLVLGRGGGGLRPDRRGQPVTRMRDLMGASLRRRRQAQGRTLREVAQAAGVSLTYLSEVERGLKEASSEVLEAICAALG